MKISENMSVNEILNLNPDAAQIFIKHGMNCLGCPGATMESLKEAAHGHDAKLEQLLDDLNAFLEKEDK